MLFVGLQCVIWSITGAYMVALNIDYIHGDSLVNQSNISLTSTDVNYELNQLYGDYPKAKEIELSKISSIIYLAQILESCFHPLMRNTQ